MTSDADHVAPVTPLFGARTATRGAVDASNVNASNVNASADVDSADATAASETGWATRGQPGADEVRGDTDARAVVIQSDHSRSEGTAVVTALPTYAAFAATTEGAVVPRVSFAETSESGDHDAGGEQSAEPAETLEAAQVRAENISLHALSRRGVSSLEMTKTLRSRDLPEEIVAAEVERLERVGLLDDVELAENLVRAKQDRKGLGKSAISSELRQRGLAQEAIDAAIADIDDDEEQARADEWALKRSGQLRGLDQATAERRLNAFLMRRGYRSEVIRRAVERALPRGGGAGRGGVRFD